MLSSRLLSSIPRALHSRTSQLGSVRTLAGVPYDKLTVGVPKETFDLEKRVGATPESGESLSFLFRHSSVLRE